MTATKELQALLERVKKATGPDRDLDRAVHIGCGLNTEKDKVHVGVVFNAYTASIDAALALVERVLPGHTAGWQPGIGNRAWATIYRVAENEVGMVEKANHATLPLAILAALLKALISQSEEKSE